MGIIGNIVERLAKRAGLIPLSSQQALGVFNAQPTGSSVRVSAESALECSPVWCAVRVISETVGCLPRHLYRRLESGREKATDHRLYQVLHRRPNPYTNASSFWQAMVAHALLRGNSYAEIQRNQAGKAIALWQLHPGHVQVRFTTDGLPYYIYSPANRGSVEISHHDMFHLRGPSPDGFVGHSVVRLARESMGLTIAAEQFGAKFFGNGAKPSAVITVPGVLDDQSYERMKREFNEVQAGLSNAHRIALLEGGTTWQSIGIPPDDAQFLQTRTFQVEEIARWFSIPVSKLRASGGRSYSTLEQENNAFLTETLQPWLVRIEEECWAKLLEPPEQGALYVEHLVDSILRSDALARYQIYAIAKNWGLMNSNEIREKENLPPIPGGGGDYMLQPLNMQPINAPNGPSAPTSSPAVGAAQGGPAPVAQPSTPAAGDPVAAGQVDVAATALNGAQVESLLNIVLQASTGVITIDTAKALAEAAFPFIDAATLQAIFGTVEVKPPAVLAASDQVAAGAP